MKLIELFNWCKNTEQKIISNLEKKEYIITFLEELVNETDNDVDDIMIDFMKQRLHYKNKINDFNKK